MKSESILSNRTIGTILSVIVTFFVGCGIYNNPEIDGLLFVLIIGALLFIAINILFVAHEASDPDEYGSGLAAIFSLIINIILLIFCPSRSLWFSLCFSLCASGAIILFINWLRDSSKQQRIEKEKHLKQQRIEKAKHIIKESVWWDEFPRNGIVLLDTNIWMDDRLNSWFNYLPEILKQARTLLLLPGFIIDEVQALLHSDDKSKKYAARLARDRMDNLLNKNCVITKNVSVFDKKSYGDPKIITFAIQNSKATIYTNDKMLVVRLKAKCNEMHIPMPKVYTFDRDYPHFCIPEELAQAYSELSKYR